MKELIQVDDGIPFYTPSKRGVKEIYYFQCFGKLFLHSFIPSFLHFLTAFFLLSVLTLSFLHNSASAGFFNEEADPTVVNEVFDDIRKETSLPHGDIANELIPSIIRVILSLFAVLLTIVAIWSGVLYIAQFGDEEKLNKAKKLLIWSLVGVAITAVSYAFVSGIVNLDWNQG